jgi:hypothetical protein
MATRVGNSGMSLFSTYASIKKTHKSSPKPAATIPASIRLPQSRPPGCGVP